MSEILEKQYHISKINQYLKWTNVNHDIGASQAVKKYFPGKKELILNLKTILCEIRKSIFFPILLWNPV